MGPARAWSTPIMAENRGSTIPAAAARTGTGAASRAAPHAAAPKDRISWARELSRCRRGGQTVRQLAPSRYCQVRARPAWAVRPEYRLPPSWSSSAGSIRGPGTDTSANIRPRRAPQRKVHTLPAGITGSHRASASSRASRSRRMSFRSASAWVRASTSS